MTRLLFWNCMAGPAGVSVCLSAGYQQGYTVPGAHCTCNQPGVIIKRDGYDPQPLIGSARWAYVVKLAYHIADMFKYENVKKDLIPLCRLATTVTCYFYDVSLVLGTVVILNNYLNIMFLCLIKNKLCHHNKWAVKTVILTHRKTDNLVKRLFILLQQ